MMRLNPFKMFKRKKKKKVSTPEPTEIFKWMTVSYYCIRCKREVTGGVGACCSICGGTWQSGTVKWDHPCKYKLVRAEKSWKKPWTLLRRNKWVEVGTA